MRDERDDFDTLVVPLLQNERALRMIAAIDVGGPRIAAAARVLQAMRAERAGSEDGAQP